MENWGLITYRETALLYNPAVSSNGDKEWVATVISHELAHMVSHSRTLNGVLPSTNQIISLIVVVFGSVFLNLLIKLSSVFSVVWELGDHPVVE